MVAIPVVAAVLIALMALLLMYGLKEFGKAIAQIFPSSIGVSVASIHPRAWVLAGVDALEAGISWVLGDVIRPMINLVEGPVLAVVTFAEGIDRAISEAADGFEWLINDGLPALRAGLVGLISAVETSVKRVALALYHDAISTLSAVETRLMGLISAVESRALSYALGLYHDAIGTLSAVETRLLARIAQVDAAVTGDVARAVAGVESKLLADIGAVSGAAKADLGTALAYAASQANNALTAAEGYAATTASAAVGVLVTDVDNALAPVATGLIDDVGSALGVIGTDFPDVSGLLRDVDLTRLGELAGGLAGTMTIVRALTRLAEDCTVPNCRNLSQFGRVLQDLLAAVEGAGFLAWLIAMITDPGPAATATEDALGGIARDTVGVVRGLVGV